MTEPDPPSAQLDPPAVLAGGAPARVLAALPGARAVGGAVRDTLAGLPVHDVDIAAPLPPEEIARRLTASGLKVFETGLAHGTVTAVADRQPVEVTSLRRDLATDGRHAEVVWTEDWREDAARRDFTINAMSMTADGRLWDYFSGREDLAAGVVRFVGDPPTRLREDYLRALRFFRFQARYGRAGPDAAAIVAIAAAVPGLGRLSAERIWSELQRILLGPDPVGMLRLMRGCGVLPHPSILPELAAAPDPYCCLSWLLAQAADAELRPFVEDAVLRLAALLGPGDDPRRLAVRLRLATAEAHRLGELLRTAPLPPAAPVFDWLIPLRLAAGETVPGLPAPPGLDLPGLARWLLSTAARADRQGQGRALAVQRSLLMAFPPGPATAALAALRPHLLHEPMPEFPLRGRDVLAAGVATGDRVGALLEAVQAWWLRGGCAADRAGCLGELQRRIAAGEAGAAPA